MDLKIRIFLDTNVLIDAFLQRNSFIESNKIILSPNLITYVSALSVVNFSYICGINDAKILSKIFARHNIIDLSAEIIEASLKMDWEDFEDAVQAASCIAATRILVTSNLRDFKSANGLLEILSPKEFIEKYDI